MIKLLHMADLHLGGRLSLFSSRAAAAWRERQLSALEQLLASGCERGAQIVLLAGDVFDTPFPEPALVARFFGILRALPVPVVIAPGNHDYLCAGGVWREALPTNVYLFEDAALRYFDFPALDLRVYGYAFTAEAMAAPALHIQGDGPGCSVLLAHADLLSPLSPYAPISGAQLSVSGFHYAALGHIHNAPGLRRYGQSAAAYSGFFAGRGFDELGEGGALLVEISGGFVDVEPIRSSAGCFVSVELDCTGDLNGEDLRLRLRRFLEEQCFEAQTALRVRLVGSVGLSCHTELSALTPLGEGLAYFEVIDETLPIYNAAYLEKEPTLFGAYYRALLPRLTAADAETRLTAAEALRLGFAALSGREV